MCPTFNLWGTPCLITVKIASSLYGVHLAINGVQTHNFSGYNGTIRLSTGTFYHYLSLSQFIIQKAIIWL